MGRFSAWAQGHAAERPPESKTAPTAAQEPDPLEAFVVVNTQLQSTSSGIKYRRSRNLEDKDHRLKPALFGSVVRGVPCDGWLKVGRSFLPMRLGSAQVLVPQPTFLEDEDDEAAKRRSAGVDPVAELTAKLWGAPAEPPPSAASRPSRKLVIPESSVQPPACSGWPHEVMWDRVVIRAAPHSTATTLDVKTKGEEVELFEWDETREWRRCPADTQGTMGWARLDHPDYGPLLRPKGLPFSARPLDPVGVAAFENNAHQLRRFIREGLDIHVRDAGNRTPLMLAAEAGSLDSCVILLDAGALVNPSRAKVSEVLDVAMPGPTTVLLSAFLGLEFTLPAFDEAAAQLDPEAFDVAEAMLERALAEREAMAAQQAEQERLLREQERLFREQARREQLSSARTATVAAARQREERYESFNPLAGGSQLPPRRSAPPRRAARQWLPGATLYKVVHKSVWIRYLPSTNAEPITTRIKGQIVELFEFDASGKWRRFEDGVTGEKGWMLLHHAAVGQLLRPLEPGEEDEDEEDENSEGSDL